MICGWTCVDLIALLWAHGRSGGLGRLLLLPFSADGTEGRRVAQRGESSLEKKRYKTEKGCVFLVPKIIPFFTFLNKLRESMFNVG